MRGSIHHRLKAYKLKNKLYVKNVALNFGHLGSFDNIYHFWLKNPGSFAFKINKFRVDRMAKLYEGQLFSIITHIC